MSALGLPEILILATLMLILFDPITVAAGAHRTWGRLSGLRRPGKLFGIGQARLANSGEKADRSPDLVALSKPPGNPPL